ncbi:RnfH [Achromatium sp. WMS2]|nr:RnfH [Achromatium sp. WMS2]
MEVTVEKFEVEVAYATTTAQFLRKITVTTGTTVKQVVEQSGLLDQFPMIDLNTTSVGTFGKLTKLDQIVQSGDRVEIYRPLIADPKAQRRKRAAMGKDMRKGV